MTASTSPVGLSDQLGDDRRDRCQTPMDDGGPFAQVGPAARPAHRQLIIPSGRSSRCRASWRARTGRKPTIVARWPMRSAICSLGTPLSARHRLQGYERTLRRLAEESIPASSAARISLTRRGYRLFGLPSLKASRTRLMMWRPTQDSMLTTGSWSGQTRHAGGRTTP